MKTLYRYLCLALCLVLTLSITIPCFATDSLVTIDSVEFEEYSDIYGERDEHIIRTKIKYTVPTGTKSVTLAFLGKNTSSIEDFAKSTIYIDQIDEPTGEFEFLIERSRVEQALGTSDIEGKTLYLKMGATGSDEADIFEVEYHTPTCMTFEGAQIRMTGEQGLRFIFSIPKTVYDKLERPTSNTDTGLGFGSVVFPKKYLGDEKLVKDLEIEANGETKKAKTVPAVNLFKVTDKYVYFTVCLLKIDESHYTEEYTAVPYITYLEDGKTITEYGMQTHNVSVFAVAEMGYIDEKSSEAEKNYLYENILTVIDPVKYPPKKS